MFFPLHDQNNPHVKIVPIVGYIIIGICLLLHVYQVILALDDPSQKRLVQFVYRHALIPKAFFEGELEYSIGNRKIDFSEKETDAIKKTWPEFNPERFRQKNVVNSSELWIWLMPVTNIFLHGSWLHLLVNIWFFLIFADNVEERMGKLFFLFFFLFTGASASIGHALLNPDSATPLVGASGAVSAIMGAYIVIFPANRITTYFCPIWFFIRRIDVPAYIVLGIYLLSNLLSMAQTKSFGASVAFDCHILGFLSGTIISLAFRNKVTQ